MTVRVVHPVPLTTVMAIIVTAIAAYALLTTGTTHADATYKPTTKVKLCNDLPTSFLPDPSMAGQSPIRAGRRWYDFDG